jgi:hypothetical protein
MSLDYSFDMATALSPEEFAREVLDLGHVSGVFDNSVTPELITTDGAVTARKAWTRVYEPKPEPWWPEVTELGITTTVGLVFELYKHDGISEQMDDVVRLSARMLERLTGDAILTGLDVLWLVRKDGILDVNENPDIWTPERLAELPQPYRRHTHSYD